MKALASGVLLGLAWFTVLNAGASLVARVVGAALLRSRHRARPSLLLFLRLLPAAASLLLVGLMFLPAHWRFEPRNSAETFGVVLTALAAAGMWLLIRSGARALGAARAGRQLREAGGISPVRIAHHDEEVYELPGLAGVSLAGVLRTRVLVGPAVTGVLSSDELAVAIDHELAHRLAWDNLKRFAMLCAPDVFGCSGVARRIEEEWRAGAESVADARAVQGDPARALHLAAALVKVARLAAGTTAVPVSPSWSTLHQPALLEMRVRRLLHGVAPAAVPRGSRPLGLAVLATLGLTTAGTALGPYVHQITEALVNLLP